MDTRTQEYKNTRIQGYRETRRQGHKNTGRQGYNDIKIRVCQSTIQRRANRVVSS